MSDRLRFRTYLIAVKPGSEYALEAALLLKGFNTFIVADGEEYATLEDIERRFAPSTARLQSPAEKSA